MLRGMAGEDFNASLFPEREGDAQYDNTLKLVIGCLAVRCGVWPLEEYVEGRTVPARVPHPRIPVEEPRRLGFGLWPQPVNLRSEFAFNRTAVSRRA